MKNSWAGGEELYINGKLQDKKTGVKLSSSLTGKLESGEEVKVSIGGGMFSVQCTLFVNNELQAPVTE